MDEILYNRVNKLESQVGELEKKIENIGNLIDEIRGVAENIRDQISDLNARFDFEVGIESDVDASTGEIEHD